MNQTWMLTTAETLVLMSDLVYWILWLLLARYVGLACWPFAYPGCSSNTEYGIIHVFFQQEFHFYMNKQLL